MEPISELDKRRNTHDAAWGLYDAERMENERLQAENAALRADNDLLRNLSFRDERDALKEQAVQQVNTQGRKSRSER